MPQAFPPYKPIQKTPSFGDIIARIDSVDLFTAWAFPMLNGGIHSGIHPVRLVVERGGPTRLNKDAVQFRYLL